MKLGRLLLAVAALATVVGLARVAQNVESSGGRMVKAASTFLANLSDEQKARAGFEFDSKERTRWHFIPLQDKNKKYTRKGLPLDEMSAEQKKLAFALLRAGTTETGNKQAVTIMSLEAILREQEARKGQMVRNPEWYFVSIFGKPTKSGMWGWRVEGHHLSLNFTLKGDEVISATPSFFGANPAEVKSGKNKGLRILDASESLAIKLFTSLSDEQKKTAYRDKPFPEIPQAEAKPNVGPPQGLAASEMNEAQRVLLARLLDAYTQRMPQEVAAKEMKEIKNAGVGKIHFAYTGGTEPGQPHTYRVQGPTFVVEFINEQKDSAGNPANHIHSAWRRIGGDFGIN